MVCDSFHVAAMLFRLVRSGVKGIYWDGREIELPRLIIEHKFNLVKGVFGCGRQRQPHNVSVALLYSGYEGASEE